MGGNGGEGQGPKLQSVGAGGFWLPATNRPQELWGAGWGYGMGGDPDRMWLLWKGLNLDTGNSTGIRPRQGRRDIYVFALRLYRLSFLIHKAGEGGAGGKNKKTFAVAQV